jgi:hypothetical protein
MPAPTITAFERSPDGGRGLGRPAYKRAFAAQLAVLTGQPPTG